MEPVNTLDVLEDVYRKCLYAESLALRGFYTSLVIEFSHDCVTKTHFNSFDLGSLRLARLIGCSKNTVKANLEKLKEKRLLRVSSGTAGANDNPMHIEFVFNYPNSSIERYGINVIVKGSYQQSGQSFPQNEGGTGSNIDPRQSDTRSKADPVLQAARSNTDRVNAEGVQDLTHIAMNPTGNSVAIPDSEDELKKRSRSVLQQQDRNRVFLKISSHSNSEEQKKMFRIAERLFDLDFEDVGKILIERKKEIDSIPKPDQLDFLHWILFDAYPSLKYGGAVRKKIRDRAVYRRFKMKDLISAEHDRFLKSLVQWKDGTKVEMVDNPTIKGEVITDDAGQKAVLELGTKQLFYIKNKASKDMWRNCTPDQTAA